MGKPAKSTEPANRRVANGRDAPLANRHISLVRRLGRTARKTRAVERGPKTRAGAGACDAAEVARAKTGARACTMVRSGATRRYSGSSRARRAASSLVAGSPHANSTKSANWSGVCHSGSATTHVALPSASHSASTCAREPAGGRVRRRRARDEERREEGAEARPRASILRAPLWPRTRRRARATPGAPWRGERGRRKRRCVRAL